MRIVLAFFAVLLACHDPPAPTTPTTPDASDASVEAASIEASVAVVETPASIPDLARDENWPEVAKRIDDVQVTQTDEGMRFLRARAALETGDAKGALERLDKIVLPAIDEEIARLRARAELEVGPYAHAAEYFAKRSDPESMLLAAKAWQSAGEKAKAMAMATKVVDGSFARGFEARARALRLALGNDPKETDDAAWLEIKAADLPESAGASKATKKRALTTQEIGQRARSLADAAMVDDALAAVATMPAGLEQKRTRGDVLYRGKRYDDAAKALSDASSAGGIHAAEDAFLSARALSRADHDDDAAKAWAEVVKKFPQSSWADESAFMIARLDFLHAKWADAAKGFDDYLTKFPAGAEKKDAQRLRAIARLLSGDHAAARKSFSNLAAAETDAIGRTRLQNLEAIAADKSGDSKFAIETWTRIAQNDPLDWPGLAARARLALAKAAVPVLAPAPASKPPLEVFLPPDAAVLHAVGLDGEAERRLGKSEASLRAGAGDRGLEALCRAYGLLDRGKRRMSLSSGIASSVLDAEPSAGTRWAWECAFPTPFAYAVTRAEAADKLPAGLVHAVMRQESGFDPSVVSPARAVGAMQLLPETASAVATEMNQPHDRAWLVRPSHNIKLGAHYLSKLLAQFHGKLPLAVASYNCGPEAVEKWSARSTGMDVDVFVETIPYLETRHYTVKVMSSYARYAYLSAGKIPDLDLSIR